MGYACPVCDDPQADAVHLANHLAFTAMLGNDRHEAWLDEHAADWGSAGPEELAERVVEHADDVEFPHVFENTVESGSSGVESGSSGVESGSSGVESGSSGVESGTVSDPGSVDGVASTPGRPPGESDPRTRRILAEARELTRRMYDELDDDEADPHPDSADQAGQFHSADTADTADSDASTGSADSDR